MNIEKVMKILEKGSIIKVVRNNITRGENGLNPHINVTVETDNSNSTTNFNLLQSDAEAYSFCLKKTGEAGVKVTDAIIDGHDGFVLKNVANESYLDDETVIWRYMDFTKFMSLITQSSFWFSRLDKLRLEDPMEGRMPNAEYIKLKEHYSSLKWASVSYGNGSQTFGGYDQSHGPGIVTLDQAEIAEMHFKSLMQRDYYDSYNTYVNCWHISAHENHAMWQVYGGDKNSVALKSTFGRLKQSLGKDRDYSILCGTVDYIDYENDALKISAQSNSGGRIITKSHYYHNEQEFRLFYSDHGYVNTICKPNMPYSIEPEGDILNSYHAGIKVPVDLDVMIESIVLNPDCEACFEDVIRNISGDKESKHLQVLGSKVIENSAVKSYNPTIPEPFKWRQP
jgi:hypothetical protein